MNQTNTQLSFLDKFKKGWSVALKSLRFIWHHKKLLFFPFLTGILIVTSIGIYEIIYYALYHKHITSFFPEKEKSRKKQITAEYQSEQTESTSQRNKKYSWAYILFLLIIVFISIFSFTFSNVALSHATTQIFMGFPINIRTSLAHSFKKLLPILVWSLCAFFMHILINMSKGKDEKGGNNFLFRLVGAAVELAWTIATFLIIPVLAHENLGIFKNIKRSAELMKKTFGQNIALALMFPALYFLIVIIWICLFLGAMVLLILIRNFIVSYSKLLLMPTALSLIGISLIIPAFLCAIVSAATIVFKTAVYHYAVGNLIGPFSEQEVQSSFEVKEKK